MLIKRSFSKGGADMDPTKRLRRFTRRCKRLFDAGLAVAKAAAPDDLVGPWKRAVGPMVVEAREERGGTTERPDQEVSLVVKVAGKTLFSAQVYVRFSGKREEHRSERVERFIPGRWERALSAALKILTK